MFPCSVVGQVEAYMICGRTYITPVISRWWIPLQVLLVMRFPLEMAQAHRTLEPRAVRLYVRGERLATLKWPAAHRAHVRTFSVYVYDAVRQELVPLDEHTVTLRTPELFVPAVVPT